MMRRMQRWFRELSFTPSPYPPVPLDVSQDRDRLRTFRNEMQERLSVLVLEDAKRTPGEVVPFPQKLDRRKAQRRQNDDRRYHERRSGH